MVAILVLGAIVVAAAWGMAALAIAKAQGASAARRVALLLFILGADVATSAVGLPLVLPAREQDAAITVHFLLDAAVPPLTLLFMARALDTPVARLLRRPPVEVALAVLALAGPALTWIAAHRVPDRGFVPFVFSYIAIVFVAAFLLALHGWRKAQGTERRRAGLFAAAFGILDLAWAFAFAAVPVSGSDPRDALLLQLAYGGGAFVFALVLGYAIVQHQLLGIDVKIRWAISRSTIAAIFVAAFFVASELAQQVFGATFGGAYAGIIAAGLLVFAMAPLQRAAERLAEKAIPMAIPDQSRPAPGSDSRSQETYRRAVRLVLRDRRLSVEEEIELAHVADGLGLSAAEATRLRHEAESEHRARGSP